MSNKNNIKYQISFLPWLRIDEEISIGPVKFISYEKFKKLNDFPQTIYDWLDKYFSRYHCVDLEGNLIKMPTEFITICYVKEPDLRPRDREDRELIWNVTKALYFAFVCNDLLNLSKSGEIENAQIFELFFQNFDPDNNFIAFGNSSITFRDSVSFLKPPSLHFFNNITFNNFDQDTLKAFDLLIKSNDNKLKNRIFRSLQWFWLCHIWRDYFSDLIKIVMMATAFEILLNFPNRASKKKFFADKLNEKISTSEFKKKKRRINKKEYSYFLAGWWGWDFYHLRNKIVHGDKIDEGELIYIEKEPDENGYWHNPLIITYLMVADAIFCELILRELYELEFKMSIKFNILFNILHEKLEWIESKKNIPGFKIETDVYGYDKE